MKKFIIANWKMAPEKKGEALSLLKMFAKLKFSQKKKTEIVVCPPFVYLDLFLNDKSLPVKVGAQNCFFEQKGAFTGEISPAMLSSIGVKYVILGHSERRRYFNEDDDIINKKVRLALKNNLWPIICVGESQKERNQGIFFDVLKKQLKGALKSISALQAKKILIAYEPVWAIGTGKVCSPNIAVETILFLRKILSQIFNKKMATSLPLLYGGSVNSSNVSEFLREKWIDGVLVGGASLKPTEFKKMIEIANSL